MQRTLELLTVVIRSVQWGPRWLCVLVSLALVSLPVLPGFGRADDPWRGPPQRRPDRAGGRRMANLGHSVG